VATKSPLAPGYFSSKHRFANCKASLLLIILRERRPLVAQEDIRRRIVNIVTLWIGNGPVDNNVQSFEALIRSARLIMRLISARRRYVHEKRTAISYHNLSKPLPTRRARDPGLGLTAPPRRGAQRQTTYVVCRPTR
jgi:hypothetical protein